MRIEILLLNNNGHCEKPLCKRIIIFDIQHHKGRWPPCNWGGLNINDVRHLIYIHQKHSIFDNVLDYIYQIQNCDVCFTFSFDRSSLRYNGPLKVPSFAFSLSPTPRSTTVTSFHHNSINTNESSPTQLKNLDPTQRKSCKWVPELYRAGWQLVQTGWMEILNQTFKFSSSIICLFSEVFGWPKPHVAYGPSVSIMGAFCVKWLRRKIPSCQLLNQHTSQIVTRPYFFFCADPAFCISQRITFLLLHPSLLYLN